MEPSAPTSTSMIRMTIVRFSSTTTTTILGNSFAMNIDCATCQDSSRLWFGFDDRECGGDLRFTVAQPKLEPGTWTHVAMSADENTTHLYINCVEVPTYLYRNNPGLWFDDLCAGPFTTLMGKSITSDGSEFHFKGRIDDLRVYNCTLSAEEIATLCDINTATAEQAPADRDPRIPQPDNGPVAFVERCKDRGAAGIRCDRSQDSRRYASARKRTGHRLECIPDRPLHRTCG